jgi:hypothetical protein
MRRLFIVLTLGLTTLVWPAAGSAETIGATAQAVGSLEADFNNNGAADLAVGVPHEAIGTRFSAGAVDVLYGGGGGLTGTGSQGFWQGTGA